MKAAAPPKFKIGDVVAYDPTGPYGNRHLSLFPPITLKEAHAKPKHPKLPCCGYCGDALVKIYSPITGVKLGCDTHGLDVPTVGDFAGLKRHP
jgi:hypothetical protein